MTNIPSVITMYCDAIANDKLKHELMNSWLCRIWEFESETTSKSLLYWYWQPVSKMYLNRSTYFTICHVKFDGKHKWFASDGCESSGKICIERCHDPRSSDSHCHSFDSCQTKNESMPKRTWSRTFMFPCIFLTFPTRDSLMMNRSWSIDIYDHIATSNTAISATACLFSQYLCSVISLAACVRAAAIMQVPVFLTRPDLLSRGCATKQRVAGRRFSQVQQWTFCLFCHWQQWW